jgi:murein DD-endopeptidase MepM/ murein hydrolase activator NlpD
MMNGLVASSLLGNVAHEDDAEPAAVVQAPARLSVSAPLHGNVVPIPGSAAVAPQAQVAPTAVPAVATNAVASSPQGELRSASRVRNPGARLQWPALGGISTFFGEEGHSGLDIMGFTGQPVTAAAAGVVTVAMESDGPYGWRVDVDHGSGFSTVYGHLSEFTVKVGDRVSAGQRIGSVGNTGLSTGPHLHFEVRTGGVTVDPLDYL